MRFKSAWLAAMLGMTFCVAAGQTKANAKKTAKNAPPAPAPAGRIEPEQSRVDSDYVIGVTDVLDINVWKEQEISRQVTVRPDGKISLPLVGEIDAAGLTPSKLREQISTRLQTFLSNPVVTVIVSDSRSMKFNVIGEVEHPGSFQLIKPMTILDGLAVAGGLKDFAKEEKIYLLRLMPDGSRVRFPFHYRKVMKDYDPAVNIELQARDTIVVP